MADRILAYRDDSAAGLAGRLDFDNADEIRQRIYEDVGYVRIKLDTFKKSSETIEGPSYFEWCEQKNEG